MRHVGDVRTIKVMLSPLRYSEVSRSWVPGDKGVACDLRLRLQGYKGLNPKV